MIYKAFHEIFLSLKMYTFSDRVDLVAYFQNRLLKWNLWNMFLFCYRPDDSAEYKCILETPISSACRRDEDRVTYLNKGKQKKLLFQRFTI